VRSDSLIRVQVWSAIAYGSRGLYYYCPSTRHLISRTRLLAPDSAGDCASGWGNGIWNVSTQGTGGAGWPTPNYAVVKAINADAQPWGTELLQGRHVGAIKRASDPSRDKSTPPAADLPVVAMDDELLVGVFVRDAKHGVGAGGEAIGWLMVVDTRTAIEPGVVPSRKASLTLHPACDVASIAPGGSGGDSALATHQVI